MMVILVHSSLMKKFIIVTQEWDCLCPPGSTSRGVGSHNIQDSGGGVPCRQYGVHGGQPALRSTGQGESGCWLLFCAWFCSQIVQLWLVL